MSEAKKPIGLRLPVNLWDDLRRYGAEHYPSSKGSEGFDVTHTIVTLLAQALGTSLDTPLLTTSNVTSDERITEIIRQQLNEMLSPTLYEYISDSQTDVSQLLNNKITEVVDAKIGEVSSELEDFTQKQLAAMREEISKLGKPLAIAK